MFKKIDPKALDKNVFSMVGDQWMLITAGTPERCNTMTASWGGLGILWNKCVATCYIRPQRYTKEFVDREEYFTLAFFGEEHRKALALCGSKSGREVDKAAECGFTVAAGAGNQAMDEGCFLDKSLIEKHYPGGDFHVTYVGEIVECLVRE